MTSQNASSTNYKEVEVEIPKYRFANLPEPDRMYMGSGIMSQPHYDERFRTLSSQIFSLECTVRELKEIISSKSIEFDASIDELYGEKV